MSLAKRLEKCARRSVGNAGWGTRHFLTLRIPRAAYPVPRPTMPASLADRLGTPDGWGGFHRDHGDGTATHIEFESVVGWGDPRTRTPEAGVAIVNVEPDTLGGDPALGWTEIRAWTSVGADVSQGRPADAIALDPNAPEWAWLAEVASVRAERRRWDDTARRLAWCSEDVRCLYGVTEFWSKTTYHADDAKTYGVTFAVKPWYVRRFAVAAARLSRVLRREGIDARWRGL